MTPRIEDYALIGDRQTAALVSRGGSIDWLCLPRFDSGACFAALLGTTDHSRWLLAPAGKLVKSRRHFREGTLVLESEYETESGAFTVVDCMPVRTGEPDLVRQVVGRRGTVRMHTEIVIRFDYGSIIPWVRRVDDGIITIAGPETVQIHGDVPVHGEIFRTFADFTVSEGHTVSFDLTWHP